MGRELPRAHQSVVGQASQRPYQYHGRWGPRGLRFASRWTRPQPERLRQRTVWRHSWDRPARQRARLPAATHATIQVALLRAQRRQTRHPVTLPPGRLRLATRPILTGSPPLTKTIGIVAVAALAAIDEGRSCAAITVT